MFGKVENGVTKSCQIFCRKNIAGETHFWAEIFHFFSREALLLFARVDIGVTESPTKTAKKEKKIESLSFFIQKWPAHPVFSGEFPFFAAEKLTFWEGGYNFYSKLASQ